MTNAPGSTPNKAYFATPYNVKGPGIEEVPLEVSDSFELIIDGLWYQYSGSPQSIGGVSASASNAIDTFLNRLLGSTNNQGEVRTVFFPGSAPSLSTPITALGPDETWTDNFVGQTLKTNLTLPTGLVVPSNLRDLGDVLPGRNLDLTRTTSGPIGVTYTSYIIGIDFALSSSSHYIVPIASGSVNIPIIDEGGGTPTTISCMPLLFLRAT